MYKIYVGVYVNKGIPNTWTIVFSSEYEPLEEFKKLGTYISNTVWIYI